MNLVDLLSERRSGVLVTLKRDGRPQLSNVVYDYDDGVISISATEDRAKTKKTSAVIHAAACLARDHR